MTNLYSPLSAQHPQLKPLKVSILTRWHLHCCSFTGSQVLPESLPSSYVQMTCPDAQPGHLLPLIAHMID